MTNINGNSRSTGPTVTPPLHTDTGNEWFFATLYGQDIRYCHTSRKWLIWDGKRWAADKTGDIYRKAKDAAITMLRAAGKIKDDDKRKALAKHALKSQYASRLKAMIDLAQSEPGISITEAELDSDLWLSNV